MVLRQLPRCCGGYAGTNLTIVLDTVLKTCWGVEGRAGHWVEEDALFFDVPAIGIAGVYIGALKFKSAFR